MRAIPGGGKAATVVISGAQQALLPSNNKIPSSSLPTTVAVVNCLGIG